MTYLDYQATTPLAPEAFDAMLPWLRDQYANPHSPHRAGRAAKAVVEVAREQVLSALLAGYTGGRKAVQQVGATDEGIAGPSPNGGDDGRLFFTGGATEAANWTIAGTFDRLGRERPRVVTIATEHACVLDSCRALERRGAEVVVLPVDRDGLVDLNAAAAAIDERTAIVAAMLVNNEIGVIQPIDALGKLARAAGAVMFCDAVQGFGRVGVPLSACDLVAVSAHKVYGPKGIGALWVRSGFEPAALLHGGGQEGSMRSGTLSPALCAGFGAAAKLLPDDPGRIDALWQVARDVLKAPSWRLNGDATRRYHGNLNVRMDGLDVARLMSDLRDLSFSVGSACASGSGRSSHVLRAIGLDERQARSSIRIGFGRYTGEAELAEAVARIDAAARGQMR